MCVIAGGVHPGGALLLANILNRQFDIYFAANSNDRALVDSTIDEAEWFVLAVFGLAVFIILPFFVQSVVFTLIGEDITEKLRVEVYRKLLRLPVRWFDRQ